MDDGQEETPAQGSSAPYRTPARADKVVEPMDRQIGTGVVGAGLAMFIGLSRGAGSSDEGIVLTLVAFVAAFVVGFWVSGKLPR
jgi:hypothetical protein